MDLIKIGNFICELRNKKGLTQEELAKKINVTNKAISRWERGVGLPDISLLEPLSNALDITILELLNGKYLNGKDAVQKNDVNIMLNVLSKKNKKNYRLFIFLTVLMILILTLAILNFAFNFQGYDNSYFLQLKNHFSIIPFVNIISYVQAGNYNSLLYNLTLNLLIAIVIGGFCYLFKKNYKFIIYINLILECIKWLLFMGIFDIDDYLIRSLISCIMLFFMNARKKDERKCFK